MTLRVHLGLFDDETAEQCHWHIPESHYLESWGDARAFDGTVTIAQPLIAPLYDGKSANEVVAALTPRRAQRPTTSSRDFWKAQCTAKSGAVRARCRRAGRPGARVVRQVLAQVAARRLHRGLGAAGAPWRRAGRRAASPRRAAGDGVEVTFSADPTVYDGRFANNGWLQETPKPFNKITWDNAALVSPATAERLGVPPSDRASR